MKKKKTFVCFSSPRASRRFSDDESVARRTLDLLKKFDLPTDVPERMTVETFEKLMAVDKKAANGKLRLILLKGDLGGCVFTADFDARVLAETLDAYARK